MTKEGLLALMEEVYIECPSVPLEDRYTYAEMLARSGDLPMVHISKLVHLSVTSLKRHDIKVKGKPKGGKFHPEMISTLRALEKQYRLDSGVSRQLVRIARQSCSVGVIHNYTGISETKLRNI